MSTIPLPTLKQSAPHTAAVRPASGIWILNSWLDMLLFVSTPLLIVPLAMFVQSPAVGYDVETISLIVSTFGGLGHHLPGMIRAYCDRDLYRRFRLRFILAPVFLLAVCIPLAQYNLTAMYLILSVWGCWHALMQVYGFVRIYDVKVGSISPVTARWDWLMCLCWFSSAQVFSNGKMSRMLEYWYNSGGPLIPPVFVHWLRWGSLGVSILVLVGFLINHFVQAAKGPRPNPAKLLMLFGSISFWWFAMVYVDNIVLGIAIFEVFHDVQYLAIVWLYNCRRVNTSPDIGSFMKFLFRRGRGMLLLYIGLVFAYGYVGLVSNNLQNDVIKKALAGIVWASTILHFYFDGFIWKVREKSTRTALGLDDAGNSSGVSKLFLGEFGHLLKWSPLIVLLTWLSVSELQGSTLKPNSNEMRNWPYATTLERMLNIAEALPDDLRSQRRAATTLANLDHRDEAIKRLKALLQKYPDYSEGHHVLGNIYHVRGNFEEATACYWKALKTAKTKDERAIAHYRLGEIHRQKGEFQLAKAKFQDALKVDPKNDMSLKALADLEKSGKLSE
jgi:hypothetical protein